MKLDPCRRLSIRREVQTLAPFGLSGSLQCQISAPIVVRDLSLNNVFTCEHYKGSQDVIAPSRLCVRLTLPSNRGKKVKGRL